MFYLTIKFSLVWPLDVMNIEQFSWDRTGDLIGFRPRPKHQNGSTFRKTLQTHRSANC